MTSTGTIATALAAHTPLIKNSITADPITLVFYESIDGRIAGMAKLSAAAPAP